MNDLYIISNAFQLILYLYIRPKTGNQHASFVYDRCNVFIPYAVIL